MLPYILNTVRSNANAFCNISKCCECFLVHLLTVFSIITVKDITHGSDVLVKKLTDLGCSVYEDNTGEQIGGNAGNIYAVLEGSLEGSILFSSHMDRVANGFGIKPKCCGSRIVSDGTTILAADDISGIAAILDGLRRIKASGSPHPRIEVLFTVCEEVLVTGSRYLDYSRFQSKIAFVLDSPGRIGRIINGAPYKAQLIFEVKGQPSHAGNAPEKGINAVVASAKVLSRIRDGRLSPSSTANWASFEAKGPSNVVNAYAIVSGEVRSATSEELYAYVEEFRKVCADVAQETGAEIIPQVNFNYEGFLIEESRPSICLMKKVFEKMQIPVIIERGGGGMDANRLNTNGIEAIGLATGYAQNHSSSEYIEKDDLIRSGEMVENIILTREY